MSLPSDRTDNSDNTPRTYTDKLLSISTTGVKAYRLTTPGGSSPRGEGQTLNQKRKEKFNKPKGLENSPTNGDLWR